MAFDPDRKLAPQIRIVENALIVPSADGDFRGLFRKAGVYDGDGHYLPLAECLRSPGLPITMRPGTPPPEAQDHLKGCWLYGGMLFSHFGHFLLQSTSRLWAAEHVDDKLDGTIFLTRQRMTWPARYVRPLVPRLRHFGPGTENPVGVVKPVRVERLVVAPQGFGGGPAIAGCPEFRDYIHRHFGRDVPAEGAEKIYISRTKLFTKRSRYLAEPRIEALLEKEGYRIFHPQTLPFEEQIAQYKAARRIISCDSSALHLAALLAGPDTQVAMTLRRSEDMAPEFIDQFRYLCGVSPVVIDTITKQYQRRLSDGVIQPGGTFSEIDFAKMGRELHAAGFIGDRSGWTAPPPEMLAAERRAIEESNGVELVEKPVD
ncbi:Protein of unknown function [Paracoccus isoporae]|uniref:Glycosyltransferase 61 catalytic domain-containing protein n=1 Tax=Paracoccus isoporae TaxID=591205 RepID=A0A1G6ZFX1_9RHOB|nr:glycosyltransferase family 61 protein [Paracoccus isoporae]SDE01351.1 Protein of unknown function [Paracoccus isoporae]